MKPGLLVIDVQRDYFHESGPYWLPGREAALSNIHRLLSAAREHGVPVFHIVHEQLDPQAQYFREGSEGAAIHPSIEVQPGERRIVKHHVGSFTETPLETYLKRAGVDTVIIAGFMTQMCCEMATRQARERGLKTVVVSDATAARNLNLGDKPIPYDLVQEVTLAVLAQFGPVLTTAETVAQMAAESRKE